MALEQWTDEQETALLKALVRWKPVGMHKHFRMLAIHDFMSTQGVINPDDEHTRIPGIWEKLGSLYNLPILDEREDSVVNEVCDENGEMTEIYNSFTLPKDEYGALMFERRLNPDGSNSPELSRRGSTVADTDEPGSSPAPGRRPGRAFRATAKASRTSKLQNEITDSRRSSKTVSVFDDETVEHAVQDDDSQESANEDESEEDEDEAASKSPAPKRRRTTHGTGRVRGTRGRGGARRYTKRK